MLYKHNENRLIEQQDDHIQEINEITIRLKHQGVQMNEQLKRQNQVISQLDEQFHLTNKKINGVQQKLALLLQTNDMSQICTVIMLLVFMIIMIVLIIIF